MSLNSEKSNIVEALDLISTIRIHLTSGFDLEKTLSLIAKLISLSKRKKQSDKENDFFVFRSINQIIIHTETILELYQLNKIEINNKLIQSLESVLDITEEDILSSSKESSFLSYSKKRDEILKIITTDIFNAMSIDVSYSEDTFNSNTDIKKEIDYISNLISPLEQNKKNKSKNKKNTVSPALSKSKVFNNKFEVTTRVKSYLLEQMMNYSEELVQIRNSLADYAENKQDQKLSEISSKLKSVSDNVLSDLLKTRMMPIGGILGKYRRIVRDLSNELNKKVELEIIGENIELDNNVIEAITEPLTHLVRNAIDHAFESPLERTKNGKSLIGKLIIHAYNASGKVIINISDDGQGIDTNKLVEKAINSNLITNEQLNLMTEKNKLELIFHPGLSTSERITTLSGRGVGMGAVKQKVEEIKGHIDISSVKNKGTNIALSFPLTMATLKVILFTIKGITYAIPSGDIKNITGMSKDDNDSTVRFDTDPPLLHKNNQVISLIDPIEYLDGLAGTQSLKTSYLNGEQISVVVFRYQDINWGLCVDSVNAFLDIVIKPLETQMNTNNIFAGAAVLGNGDLALVIDLKRIVIFSRSHTSFYTEAI